MIYCYTKEKELLFFTDIELAENIKAHSWCKHANGYSATHINGKEVAAHRFITNAKKGELVDHANGNKKDCRRANLRKCDKSQNAYNTGIRKTNSSGKTGVYLRKDTGKWTAEIKHHNKKICLGCYDSYADAVKAREKAEEQYIGEYRRVANE